MRYYDFRCLHFLIYLNNLTITGGRLRKKTLNTTLRDNQVHVKRIFKRNLIYIFIIIPFNYLTTNLATRERYSYPADGVTRVEILILHYNFANFEIFHWLNFSFSFWSFIVSLKVIKLTRRLRYLISFFYRILFINKVTMLRYVA